MKKLCLGVLLASALLFAQKASAEPCGLCQAYYPCSWSCEDCVAGFGGPGLWIDGGGCWGEVVESTCGESGQCSGGQSLAASWHSAPVWTAERSTQLLLAQITSAPSAR